MKKSKTNTDKYFQQLVAKKEERKLQAQHDQKSVWSGLGLFGIIGWSIVLPTFLGAAFGIWLDNNYKQDFSWTLTMLVVGLMIGCLIAWNWIAKENKEIHKKNDNEND